MKFQLIAPIKAPNTTWTSTTPGSFAITNLEAYQKAWTVADRSIQNWQLPAAQRRMLVPHADHFATVAAVPAWSLKRPSMTIGDHAFYALN